MYMLVVQSWVSFACVPGVFNNVLSISKCRLEEDSSLKHGLELKIEQYIKYFRTFSGGAPLGTSVFFYLNLINRIKYSNRFEFFFYTSVPLLDVSFKLDPFLKSGLKETSSLKVWSSLKVGSSL